jgi:peptidoglycan/xylan/chitin deacetylase (PgdA/CDA1 family)
MQRSSPELPRFPWPSGKQAAVAWSFDVDAETALLSQDPQSRHRLAIMTHQMFGPLVGVPRILDVLRRKELESTFFVPGYTAERYPDMVRQIVAAGHEIGHHGYLHEPLVGMTAQQEADMLDKGLDALERVSGVRPKAFRAPVGEMSFLTPPLLADRGFRYDSSLMDSDFPYCLDVGDGSGRTFIELPFHWSSDDWEQYNWIPGFDDGRPIETPKKVQELWRLEIEAQIRYGGLFNLVNHPFVTGRASRILAMEELIDELLDDPRVWFASLGEIADHVESLHLTPRTHAPYSWPN